MTAPTTPRVVAVTGAAGYIGAALVRQLLATPGVERVLAFDVRPLAVRDVRITFVRQDIARPMDALFGEHHVEAAVHLAFAMRQLRARAESRRVNVAGSANFLHACAAAGVRRVVFMSSATVYGARRDNPPRMAEDAPPRPPIAFHYPCDKAEVERMFARHAEEHPDALVAVPRACVVMGPHANNFITAALGKPLLIGVRAHDPGMQFVHEDDLVKILVRLVLEPHAGVFNVAGPGTVRWSQVARLAGRAVIWLPAPAAYAVTDLAWHLRLQSDAPGPGLDYVRWPWVVDTQRLEREFGFRFAHTSEEALRAYLERPRAKNETGTARPSP